jgi:hypothetical protein
MLPITVITSIAQEMPVPIAVQARFFKKVFGYDKTVPRDNISIVIVYGEASADIRNDIVEAFSSIGIKANAVKAGQLSSLSNVHVVYYAPGADLRAVKEYCRSNGVLSITGLPNLARNGDISIALDAINDAPKVIVNSERLKTERQDAADLMRLR